MSGYRPRRSFNCSGDLKRHARTHTSERPFKSEYKKLHVNQPCGKKI